MKKTINKLASKYQSSIIYSKTRNTFIHPLLSEAYRRLFSVISPQKQEITVRDTNILTSISEPADEVDPDNPYNEKEVIHDIFTELKESDVFWDVGANRGFYSMLAAKKGVSKVYSFEPNPRMEDKLTKNASINNVEITLKGIALSNKNKTESLENLSSNFGANKIKGEFKIKTGDHVIENACKTPDVMKIDVEGAEFNVLKGLEQNLKNIRSI